jgi:thioredoxin-related protein
MRERKDWLGRVGLGFALFCWLGAIYASALALSPEAIPWRTDFHRAEMEARARGRLLWVQFTGPWCPNCQRMERESFVHPRVVDQACSHFIPVKVQSDQHEDLVDRFGLKGIPATVLVKPSGEVMARQEGYVDAGAFHGFLERAWIQSGHSLRPTHANLTRPLAPGPGAATVTGDLRSRTPTATSLKLQHPGSENVRR